MARPKKVCAASAIQEPVSYHGQHFRGVDHGRIILPPEWRPEGAPRQFTFLAWPVLAPEYLLVLPPWRWRKMLTNLAEVSLANEKEAVVERLLGARSFQKSLDSYGRLVLPDDTLRMVRIEREAVLVGRLDKFEIWAPDNYHASLAKPEIRKIVLNTLKSKKI